MSRSHSSPLQATSTMFRYLKCLTEKPSSTFLMETAASFRRLGTSNGCTVGNKTFASYVQGQSPEPRVREYFYYIDHQGMLFLDDSRMKNFTSCFKDKKFLAFFFKRLRRNETGRYSDDFPYLSVCGRERNFVRCDDLPIVFTHVIQKENGELGTVENLFSYAHAGELLTFPFQPSKIFMSMKTGRVYHPAPDIGGSVGLVQSKLAIEFSKFLQFENGEEHGPTHFSWEGNRYELNSDWYRHIYTTV